MTWAARRKALYITVAGLFVAVIGGSIAYGVLSKEPTCEDGVQNGEERGVDCGGACALICREDTREPVVLWARSFAVAPGLYTAAAYIHNGNPGAKAPSARYVFKLFDEKNILIAERRGEVTIAAQETVPVIETNIATGNRIPIRTFFEFAGDISWEREERVLKLRVVDERLSEEEKRFEARVLNDARDAVGNLIVPVVLFDEDGNAHAASKSILESIAGGGSDRIVFTWPSVLASTTRTEVIPYRAD